MAEDLPDFRTPLGRVRFMGAGRTGTGEAWLMHVTSLALIPLTVGFVWMMLDLLRRDYNGVRAALGHPLPAIVLLAFLLTGIFHMELGMRSIIVDYIHTRWRPWSLAANTCFCALLGLACVYATLRITFT